MKSLLFVVFLLSMTSLHAKGVKAGTVIKNSASLTYSMAGKRSSIKSNIVKSFVAQVLDVKVSWIDTSPTVVTIGEKKKVLTYKILNNGNGADKYTLIADEQGFKSDFVLSAKKVYLDINKNYRFDSEDRIRKTVSLNADSEQLVFVVSSIDENLEVSSGSQNFVNLRAVSRIGGSGVRGKISGRKGLKGVQVLDGLSGGVGEDEGSYKLLVANVILNKNVVEKDGVITVSIDVTVGGDGSVKDVNILDEIPNETLYVKNSLVLDGVVKTDQDDSDEGRYRRKYKERKAQIILNLGELDTSSHHQISYELTIR